MSMRNTNFLPAEHWPENQLRGDGPPINFLVFPAMSAGVYVLSAGAPDPQNPHGEDEIYYLVSGKAKMRIGAQEHSVGEGSVIYVDAGLEHRFFDIEEELVVQDRKSTRLNSSHQIISY